MTYPCIFFLHYLIINNYLLPPIILIKPRVIIKAIQAQVQLVYMPVYQYQLLCMQELFFCCFIFCLILSLTPSILILIMNICSLLSSCFVCFMCYVVCVCMLCYHPMLLRLSVEGRTFNKESRNPRYQIWVGTPSPQSGSGL